MAALSLSRGIVQHRRDLQRRGQIGRLPRHELLDKLLGDIEIESVKGDVLEGELFGADEERFESED